MKTKKVLVLLFLILLSYLVYSVECSTVGDCDDDNYCTIDSCDENCSYTNVSGCIQDNFKFIGDTFVLGEGACRDTYEYDKVEEDTNEIVLKKGLESVSLTFGNTSNYYGHPINYNFEILNETVTFNLRYNETEDFLYLEDINKSCPISDLCLTNEDCDDNNTCTIDECDGTPLACVNHFIAYCKDSDGCCPGQCNATEDNDCMADQCSIDSDCGDNDPCTNDLCNGTPYLLCLNVAVTDCADNDYCCPASCTYDTDKDCERPIVCGDNICEADETSEGCCTDCGCAEDFECVEDTCQKTKEAIAQESLEINEEFKENEDELISNGFSLREALFSKTVTGFNFEYIYIKGDKERAITGIMDNQNNIRYIAIEGGTPVLWYIVIIVLIFLITIFGLSFYRNLRHKKEEEKEKERESYYSRLLQQRAQKPRGPFYRR